MCVIIILIILISFFNLYSLIFNIYLKAFIHHQFELANTKNLLKKFGNNKILSKFVTHFLQC